MQSWAIDQGPALSSRLQQLRIVGAGYFLTLGEDGCRAIEGFDVVDQLEARGDVQGLHRALHARHERSTGADAGVLIFSSAARTRDYVKATLAVKALYRFRGAREALRRHFDRHVDIESASETDRALLRCVYGDPEQNAAAG